MTTAHLSQAQAHHVASAALSHAAQLGLDVAVAVDAGGHPVVTLRGDETTFLNARLALAKAVTAAGMGLATADLVEQLAAASSPVVAGLSTQPEVRLLPGAVPLRVGGSLVGAIGVSGPAGEDVPVAVAGADALAS